jgi:Protein chain release factor A
MIPEDRLEQIKQRFEYVEARMAQASGGDDIAALGREYAELKPVVDQIAAYRQLRADLADAEAMLDDPDMRELAEEDLPVLQARVPEAEAALQLALLPKDAADARPAMIEIRPGTGGEEAALFAGDLLSMYHRYAEARGWSFDIVEEQHTYLGGIKEVMSHVKGDGFFARL